MTTRTTTTHTPGPWEAETVVNGAFEIATIRPDHYRVICSRQPWHHRAEESLANARLIAAAPDLLAVCKAYREECRRQGIKFGPINGDADEAIAKAEGAA